MHNINPHNSQLEAGLILDHMEKACPRVLELPFTHQIIRMLFKKQASNKPSTATSSPTNTTTIKTEREVLETTTPPLQSTSHAHYLLPLLLSRVGWTGIRETINYLLPKKPTITASQHRSTVEKDNLNDEMVEKGCIDSVVEDGGLDGGMVVWFLEACFNMPSLWSGRDKKSSRVSVICTFYVISTACIISSFYVFYII